jgi:putative membrane protein
MAWPLAAAAALIMAAAPVLAQQAPATGQDPAAPVRSTEGAGRLEAGDRTFIDEATQANQLEVDAGRLAQRRARQEDVRDFAQRMVEDHEKAGLQLAQIAASLAVTPGREPSPDTRARLQKLQDADADGFDAVYVASQIEAHRTAIALFQREAESGRNPQLTGFAEQTLPTLQSHLAHAEALGAGASAANTSPAAAGSSGSSTEADGDR